MLPDLPPPCSPPAHEGFLDTVGPHDITGWAFDPDAPGQHLTVELLCDGAPIAEARADRFRADLAQAGKGDGRCAFRLPLPMALADGRAHAVAVRVCGSALLLPEGATQFQAEPIVSEGALQLDAGALVGGVRLALPWSDAEGALEVRELAEATAIAHGHASRVADDPTRMRYRIALPTSLFDGRPHAFTVHRSHDGLLLQSIALVMPHVATPEHALLRFARDGAAPRLNDLAGYRYDALARGLANLGRGDAALDRLAQLQAVHARVCKGPDAGERHYARLTFATHSQPRVSIVIPVFNQFHLTYHCLASLLLAPNTASFEIIVVDDGSDDRTQTIAQWVDGITVLRNTASEGFVHACNRGAQAARGEYLVLLNNDTEVTPDWLDELLWPFAQFDRVGMTGAKLLYPDGRLQEAGGIVWSSANPANYGRGGNPQEPRYNYTRQVDYLSGACLMVPTELWHRLGGLDPVYAPAYFEDTDLAFRVRAQGFKTVYAPLSRVVHFEGGSHGTDVQSGGKRHQEANRPTFRRRWLADCAGHGREGADADWEKDRHAPLRALVIDMQTPAPDRDAGSYAAVQEMRLLQALGFKCSFVPQNLQWMGRYTEALQRMGVECLHAPFVTSIAELLRQRGREFDLVYISRYHVARQQLPSIRAHAPQAKVVLMNCDLHFLRELRRALRTRDAEDLQAALGTRQDELSVMRDVDLVLTYTQAEQAVIESHNLDSAVVAQCPWVQPVVREVAPFAQREGIAFLGGFGHPPNEEAVMWFLENIWEDLRKALPGVLLHIYGSQVSDRMSERLACHADVRLHGWVEHVSTAYASCRVFIAPLQSGAGIKGKVIGALAHGVPSVLSPLAAEGIAVAHGTDAFVATTTSDWTTAVTKIYEDEERWGAMSERARQFASAHYSFARGQEQMQRALEQADIFSHASDATLVAREPVR